MLFGLFAICTLFYTSSVHSASLDAEKSSETVKLKLYQYSSQEWVANNKASLLQTRLAADANSYCDSSPTLCGLLYWDNLSVFSSANVGITPVDKKKNMEIEVYITLPNGANVSSVSTTAFVLNKAATYAIVTANKDGIETAIGLTVTYIDTTYYGIPISVKENQIIIPIAIVFVLILIIIVIAMHMWQKRRTKKGRQLRKQENRFKMGRVSPGKEAVQTINGNWHQENSGHVTEHISTSAIAAAPVLAVSVNEFTDTTVVQSPGHQLPPLTNDEFSGEKKKKKKRKSKRKKHREDGHDAGSESEAAIPSYHSNLAETQETTFDL